MCTATCFYLGTQLQTHPQFCPCLSQTHTRTRSLHPTGTTGFTGTTSYPHPININIAISFMARFYPASKIFVGFLESENEKILGMTTYRQRLPPPPLLLPYPVSIRRVARRR